MGVKRWAMELKEELLAMRFAFVWRKQHECNLRDISRSVKGRCNDTKRQNISAKFLEKSSLTLYRKLNFVYGKKLYIEWCSRKEWSGIVWLLAGIWQLTGIRWNTDRGRCPLYSGEEDAKHTLLDCKDNNHWRIKLIHDKWLNMDKEVDYRKIVKIPKHTYKS
jgi:hypothetical protein